MSFGKDLLQFRAKYGLSQFELAKIIDVSPLMVCYYENNKNQPRKMNKIRIESEMKKWEENKKC